VLDAEGSDVAEGSEEVGDQDVAGENADKVVGDEGPNRELRALCNCSSCEK
jgi:hypothetical protein